MKAVLLAIAASAACAAGATTKPQEVQPEDEVWLSPEQLQRANVRVAAVEAHAVPERIAVAGHVAFDDLRVSHVFSPVTGRVTRVLAKPGQRVTRGTPLLALASPDVGTAFSDVVKAQADVQATEADLHREERLISSDATSRRSLEAAQDAYRRATAEYERARQRAAMLRGGGADAVTQEYVLRAFMDGDVIARNVSPGMEVAGQYSGGNALELFTIGDIKNVWVYADVPDVELARLGVGEPVEIRVTAYPDRVFHGAIDFVSSTVDPALRTVRVRCSLPNQGEELKPEMLAAVSILLPAVSRLAVPRDAVVAINEGRYVYVEGPARANGRHVFKRRAVTIGAETDGLVPISSGVAERERVVVTGSAALEQPNDEVRPTLRQVEQGKITTASAVVTDVSETVRVGGRLTFDDTKISHVFSPVNGRITKVFAQPGQRVAQGAPLAAITSPDLAGYVADVVKAEADRTQADHEMQRQRELYEAGVGAKRDLDFATDALRKASAEYDRARQLASLLRGADYDRVTQEFVLRSPIAGEVIARKVNPGLEVQGQYSNGGAGSNVAELFTVGEIGELWLLGEIYEQDLPRVQEGEAVSVEVAAYPGKRVTGRVEWVSDVLDPVQHTAKVRCVVDNAEHLLKPEMYERTEITVPAHKAVVVPRNAVMRVDGQTVVFVRAGGASTGGHDDNQVVFKRRVVTARLDDNAPMVAVSSGLAAGEVVAVDHSLVLLGML